MMFLCACFKQYCDCTYNKKMHMGLSYAGCQLRDVECSYAGTVMYTQSAWTVHHMAVGTGGTQQMEDP